MSEGVEKRDKRLILASASPRRKMLLERAGYEFEVVIPELGEFAPEEVSIPAEFYAEAVAYFKARSVADGIADDDVVILAADTIVVCDEEIIGKADSEDEAREILRKLSHNKHCVITGVAVIDNETGCRLMESDKTEVVMKPLTEEEIEGYIRSGNWIGKAGAYAIQEGGDRFVVELNGSFTNVVGLPMELVKEMLGRFGVFPREKKDDDRTDG